MADYLSTDSRDAVLHGTSRYEYVSRHSTLSSTHSRFPT